jgi:hypothetical protein
MIETLLEAGLEPERFRVFTGAETEIAVSYRPVVDLTGEGSEQTAASEPAKRGDNGHDTKGARISGVFQGAADEAQ